MKAGVDDYIVAHGPEALEKLLAQTWTPDPSWNDIETEIWWQLRFVSPDSKTSSKLKALCGLAPLLAQLSHIEVAALLADIRVRLKLRAKDLTDLERDIKAERQALKSKGKGERQAPKLENLEEVRRLHPAVDFQARHMNFGSIAHARLVSDNDYLMFIAGARWIQLRIQKHWPKHLEETTT